MRGAGSAMRALEFIMSSSKEAEEVKGNEGRGDCVSD
jgi:hypothetical protein